MNDMNLTIHDSLTIIVDSHKLPVFTQHLFCVFLLDINKLPEMLPTGLNDLMLGSVKSILRSKPDKVSFQIVSEKTGRPLSLKLPPAGPSGNWPPASTLVYSVHDWAKKEGYDISVKADTLLYRADAPNGHYVNLIVLGHK